VKIGGACFCSLAASRRARVETLVKHYTRYLAVDQSIVRLDDRGIFVSRQSLDEESMIIGIESVPDGGYIAAGMKYETVWVLKLDAEGSRPETR